MKNIFIIWALALLPLMLCARICWQARPGQRWCRIFWALSVTLAISGWILNGVTWWKVVAFLGVLGNATATLANDGYMPVNKKTERASIWIPLTERTRFAWLCDIYGGFSLGDFLIIFALIAGAFWL